MHRRYRDESGVCIDQTLINQEASTTIKNQAQAQALAAKEESLGQQPPPPPQMETEPPPPPPNITSVNPVLTN